MFPDNFYQSLLENLHDGVYYVDRSRRIQYWNRAAEELTGFSAEEVTGHCCADNILRHVNYRGEPLCRSACPLSLSMRTGENQSAEVFLHHKEGHRVHVSVRIAPIRDADDNIIGAVEIFNDNTSKRQAFEQLNRMKASALLCPLTGIGNRRYGERVLHNRLSEADRYSVPFAVLFADIDHFKQINDQHGHATGDRALRAVAKTLTASVRESDYIVRWGGEEFVGILSSTREEDLATVAERCRSLIAGSQVEVEGGTLGVTISLGGTVFQPGDTMDTIIARADSLMYQSKTSGRDRVTLD